MVREQVVSYAMAGTSCQLCNGENKLSAMQWQEQVVSYTMARTNCQLGQLVLAIA
jgi:hypothetical protein